MAGWRETRISSSICRESKGNSLRDENPPCTAEYFSQCREKALRKRDSKTLEEGLKMFAKISRRILTSAACCTIGLSGLLVDTGPAQAVTDPFPNAPICVVDSDHVTIKSGMAKGMNTNSVKEAQCWLNRNGANLAVDGSFGPATDAAVRSFQSSKGLAVDGVVGHDTWNALINGAGNPPAGDRAAKVNKVINYAKAQINKPYKLGAAGPDAFDCSGLTLRAYQQVGINLPRVSEDQAAAYPKVSAGQAQPGDLVHWSGHVAIYLGNGQIIDAGSTPHKVTIRGVWGSPTYHRVIP